MFPVGPIGSAQLVQPMSFVPANGTIPTQNWSPIVAKCEGPSCEELGVEPLYKPNELLDALEKRVHDANEQELIAHVMATCTAYAYSDAPTLSRAMTGLGLEKARYLILQELVDAMSIWATAFVIQSSSGKSAILCYRGTVPLNLNSWLTNLDVGRQEFPFYTGGPDGDPCVHAGFYRNVEGTIPTIAHALTYAIAGKSILAIEEPLSGEDDSPSVLEKLYITGHSLGGAMAVLAAAVLKSNPAYQEEIAGRAPISVYTFGQPMVGNQAFGKKFEASPDLRLHRYIYRRDIVPRLPSQDVAGEFAHFGNDVTHLAPKNEAGKNPPNLDEAKMYLAEVVDDFAERAILASVRNEIHQLGGDVSRMLEEINRSLLAIAGDAVDLVRRKAVETGHAIAAPFRVVYGLFNNGGGARGGGNGAAPENAAGRGGRPLPPTAGTQVPVVQNRLTGDWPPPAETILDFLISANVMLVEKFRQRDSEMPYCSLADHFPNHYVDALKPAPRRAGDRFKTMVSPQTASGS